MNATPRILARLWSLLARPPARLRESQPGTKSRRSARSTVVWFVLGTVALSSATLLATDVFAPTLRDPEYGWRAARLRARVAENPDRPLVLVIGSSRVGGAICPAAWEAAWPADAARPKPMLFNMGRAGAGPILQLMTLRRVYAEGFRPAVVLIEYWPPVANEHGGSDFRRITPDQMFAADLPVVRECAKDAREYEWSVWRNRMNPIWGLRRTFMLQLDPEWLPWPKRTEILWINQDPWGWVPGPDLQPEGSEERARYLAASEKVFKPQLRAFAFTPQADRALYESVALARQHGATVGLVYLPESSEFRSWYPAKALKVIEEHLAEQSRELNVPVIDCRTWLPDGYLPDGFHLSKRGGIEFTKRLLPAVAMTFPNLGGSP